jgi:hypothetical protein
MPAESYGPDPAGLLLDYSRDWSSAWGEVLHTRLAHPSMPTIEEPLSKPMPGEYLDWWYDFRENEANPGLISLARYFGTDALRRSANELNFHELNACMTYMWAPIFHGHWPSPEKQRYFTDYSMDFLAYISMSTYVFRRRHQAALNPEVTGMLNGLLQEFDMAIVLLSVLQPGETLVPGPAQVERASFVSKHGNNHADYVLYDTKRQRAVGIQAKTARRTGDNSYEDKYDLDRIVLLYGDDDLNNIILPPKDAPTGRRQQWPGRIAVNRMLAMQTVNKNQAIPIQRGLIDSRQIVLLKMAARSMSVNGTIPSVDLKAVRSKVRAKIDEKL